MNAILLEERALASKLADDVYNRKLGERVAAIEEWEASIERRHKTDTFVNMLAKRLIATLIGVLLFMLIVSVL